MKAKLDEKSYVTLGGVPQRIHIRTNDETLPVLLFLHGGPGVCNRHTILHDHDDLMDSFTLVGWDQRGSGGSYYNVPEESLTVDQMVEDARELVELLCERFGQEKIFIIGGSWGSLLGTHLAKRYPEHIRAFVGFGQVVNIEQNELISWQFSLDEASRAGDEAAVAKLKEVGPPVMGVYKGGYDGMMVQRNIMMKYGGYSQNKAKRSYAGAMLWPILRSCEYSPKDLYGYIKGYKRVLKAMWEEIGRTDFKRDCTKFEVPVLIMDGRLDQNTPSVLVQDWFDLIEAPSKELIWFEKSGHNPMGDEPGKFKMLLRDRLSRL